MAATRRAWHSPLVRGPKAQIPPPSFQFTTYVLIWYAASLAAIILNKHLLSPPAGSDGKGGGSPRVEPMALAFVQTVSTVLLGAFSQARSGFRCLQSSLRHRSGERETNAGQPRGMAASALLGLGFMRFLVTILGLVSLRHVAASFTETVKASSPFFTVIAAFTLMGEWTPLRQVAALIPVVGGLMVATASELSFTVIGFGAALSTNCVECVQNVICKRLLSPGGGGRSPCAPAQLQYYTAAASLLVQLPLFAGAWLRGALTFPSETSVLCLLALNGCISFLQSALVFEVMSHCSPVTVSVLNTAKRALIICFSAAYFGNSIAPLAQLGTAMTLAGSCLYSVLRVGSGPGKLPEEEKPRPRSRCASESMAPVEPGARPRGRCQRRRGRGRSWALSLAALLAAVWPAFVLARLPGGGLAPRHPQLAHVPAVRGQMDWSPRG